MMHIGRELKRIRRSEGMTLEELSQKCGYSKALISRVENEKISPSLVSLQKIASSLGLKIHDVFLSVERGQASVVRRGEGRRFDTDGKASLEYLTTDIASKKMEPTKIIVSLGFHSGKTPVVHCGEEFLLVLKGKIEVTTGERTRKLVAGDALYLPAGTPYRWCNAANGTTEVLSVVTPPRI
ncbi:MAG: helix-turn-helix transcriptional regulator [Candidatus Hydrogenedentota bacterium]|nr:MAG: helix-turn-helix transcriptional regulator [Candidatus Hydrogenedentota bacterium]